MEVGHSITVPFLTRRCFFIPFIHFCITCYLACCALFARDRVSRHLVGSFADFSVGKRSKNNLFILILQLCCRREEEYG